MANTVRHSPTPRRGVPSNRPTVSAASRPASSSREVLDNLTPYPIGAVLHGTQGVGKTAILAHLPDVGFVVSKKEMGIRDLNATRQAPEPLFTEVFDEGFDLEKNPPWNPLLALNWSLAADNRGAKNIVFDSLTWVEACGMRADCKENYGNDFGKEGYFAWQTGPKSFAKAMWQNFLDSLEGIKEGGANVWLIAHTTVKAHNQPGSLSYDRFIPYLDKEVWAQTFSWAQLVLFYNFEAQITPMSKKTDEKRGRVQTGSQCRMLYTDRTEAYDAKNRWGMTPALLVGNSGKEAYNSLEQDIVRCFNV